LLGLKVDIPLETPNPEDIKAWVKQAENNNLGIKSSKIDLEISKRAISIAESGHYPTVDLSAGYSRSAASKYEEDESTDPDPQESGLSSDRSIGLSLSVPIYAGGSVTSQVRQSQYQHQQAAHNLEAERRKAVSAARSSYLGVIASVSSVKAYKQSVISSESALQATQAGFDVGTRTIVEVLEQTQNLYNAKRNYAKARYDYILNTLKLKQAAGLLTDEDIVSINKMLR
jgi:outer membrane protein